MTFRQMVRGLEAAAGAPRGPPKWLLRRPMLAERSSAREVGLLWPWLWCVACRCAMCGCCPWVSSSEPCGFERGSGTCERR